MVFSYQDTQNEFLVKWITGTLTYEEHIAFINSSLYRNLVISKATNRAFTKH